LGLIGTSAPPSPLRIPGSARQHPQLLVPGRAPLRLDRSAIVGVRPSLSRVQVGSAPHLVSVESPSGEISRSHVELRLEGFTVLAVDLNSTNGTMLIRVGKDPVRLQPGEPSMVVAGDQLDLGDGVVLGFEGLA
ncbi:MAG: FHA domain-containing protein, partial [Micropruina sp.]